jgi:hypothetical protein
MAAPGDDFFVFLLSDANLSDYGVSSHSLASVLVAEPKVHAYAIFIAGQQDAKALARDMPLGHAHVVTNTRMLPKIFKDIFSAALIPAAL